MRIARRVVPLGFAGLMMACGRTPAPAPPAPAVLPLPATLPPPTPTRWEIRVCVVRDGAWDEVTAEYNGMTGDTLLHGRPFAEAYPLTDTHAASARWYAENELITFGGRRYVKLGTVLLRGPGQLVPVGTYRGVPLFRDAAYDYPPPDALFALVRPTCEFQLYDLDLSTSAVRG